MKFQVDVVSEGHEDDEEEDSDLDEKFECFHNILLIIIIY